MIREGRKLPDSVELKVPEIIEMISREKDISALYVFGSLGNGDLKPLSDLDFGILLSRSLDKAARFEKQLLLIGLFTETFGTDEIDLVVMNDAPLRIAYEILRSGKLVFCGNKKHVVDFYEKTVKFYLDFKFFRDNFNQGFLEGIGYYG